MRLAAYPPAIKASNFSSGEIFWHAMRLSQTFRALPVWPMSRRLSMGCARKELAAMRMVKSETTSEAWWADACWRGVPRVIVLIFKGGFV